jgi:3-phosphoshikimate 1-carboxyvinyltransferase
MTARKGPALFGTARIPGDKSISHRALMFGGLARGRTTIYGLLEGEDVINTANAMRAMGANIEKDASGTWHCEGTGLGNLASPAATIDMGNSGTSTRLLMGVIGGHAITARMTGDASLTKRPMARVMTPLESMGVRFESSEGGRLPLTVFGTNSPRAIDYRLPVASAQVKSAVLLAALTAEGTTSVIEEKPTRDHTENMLRGFGVTVDVEDIGGGAQAIHLRGGQQLHGTTVHVPSDPSSAAFPCVAAIINQGSDVTLPSIGMNEQRNGLYVTLREMGADIGFNNDRIEAGERVADLVIRGIGPLTGIDVPESRVPSMIDEFPILAMAAACAHGTTRMTGLEELRVKESDRLLMVAKGLEACGVHLEMGADWLSIHGTGKPPRGGAIIETALDHRIAMSFLVLGTVTDQPVAIDDARPVNTSFPDFFDLMATLGARFDSPA